MQKFFLIAAAAATVLSSAVSASDRHDSELPVIGVVNFASCITESKAGKKEQENLEVMRKQLTDLVESTDMELREISAKFEDPEYLDSLSPKAEEELKTKFQARQEDLSRYQNQFYQMMNHAQMQMLQKISGNIAKASEMVASERKLDYVMNKEACFYIRPDLDVTPLVIGEMDKNFELDEKARKLTDNVEQVQPLDETLLEDQAG